jgi:hypothetical protein
VGEPPRAYIDARPAMMRINTVYQPMVYERPVITVDAPVGWIGARAEFVGPGVTVEAHLPAPSLRVDVGIGVPGVIVHERAPAVIVRDRPVIIRERVRVKHDNGRHRGHYRRH